MTMDENTGTRDIVRRLGGAAPAATAVGNAALQQWREEHLVVPGTSRIRFEALPSDDSVADQMARRVAGDPGDARLHVARVNHHVVQRDADAVYAALVDLFLAFEEGGAGLRARLLDGGRQLIGSQRAGALDAAVRTGLSPKTAVPPCPGSVLSRGVTGNTDIVRRRAMAVAQ
jgi:hypothetical protein